MRTKILSVLFCLVILGLAASSSGAKETATTDKTNAEAAVQRAANQGRSAVKALGREARSDPALVDAIFAAAQTDPMVATVLVNSFSTTEVESNVREPVLAGQQDVILSADRANCYPKTWAKTVRTAFDKPIFWVKVTQDGWCTKNGRIVTDFGWHGSSWAWGPYCVTNYDHDKGWADYPFKKYGETSGSLGLGYVFGCGSIKSSKVKITIKGNGGWNHFHN